MSCDRVVMIKVQYWFSFSLLKDFDWAFPFCRSCDSSFNFLKWFTEIFPFLLLLFCFYFFRILFIFQVLSYLCVEGPFHLDIQLYLLSMASSAYCCLVRCRLSTLLARKYLWYLLST